MTWNPLALATALQTVPEQNIDVKIGRAHV